MSKFRNITADARKVAFGLPSPKTVPPDGIVEVSDAIARAGRAEVKDEDGNVTRPARAAETFADGYRIQPTIWAEVSTPPKLAPPKADETKEVTAK